MARVIKIIFQLRRGLHDKWIEENPILSEGEPAFETDTFRLKIGDGKTAYQALPYIGEDWSEGKDGTGIESIAYKGEDEAGGGDVVEATGHARGVVKTKLAGRGWYSCKRFQCYYRRDILSNRNF